MNQNVCTFSSRLYAGIMFLWCRVLTSLQMFTGEDLRRLSVALHINKLTSWLSPKPGWKNKNKITRNSDASVSVWSMWMVTSTFQHSHTKHKLAEALQNASTKVATSPDFTWLHPLKYLEHILTQVPVITKPFYHSITLQMTSPDFLFCLTPWQQISSEVVISCLYSRLISSFFFWRRWPGLNIHLVKLQIGFSHEK